MIQRNISLIIFIFFFSLYTLTMNGYVSNIDSETRYSVTKNIVERHDFSANSSLIREVYVKAGRDGKLYSIYGIGQSLIAIPFFLIGWVVSLFFNPELKDFITRFAVMFSSVFISALWCVLIFQFSLLLRYSIKIAIIISLTFGLSTLTWPYSKYFFTEPLLGFFIYLSLYLLLKSIFFKKTGALILSGLCLGIAVMVKLVGVLVLPLYLVYLVYKLRQFGLIRVVKSLVAFLLPVFLVFCCIMFYNYIRFGNVFDSGYPEGKIGNTLFGLYGLLLSPGKSLFIYSPVLILIFFALKGFHQRYKSETLLLLGVFLVFLILFASVVEWDGGVCWGTRYLLPVIPSLVIPLGILLEPSTNNNLRLPKVLFIALFFCGILVQLLPVLVRYDIYINEVGKTTLTDLKPCYFPIIGQAKKLSQMDLAHFKNTDISGLNIHSQDFKEEFAKTFDIWFMYLAKFRKHEKLASLSLIPLGFFIAAGLFIVGLFKDKALTRLE